eukprot:6182317-Pleurochrysis_carterae.AAC.1
MPTSCAFNSLLALLCIPNAIARVQERAHGMRAAAAAAAWARPWARRCAERRASALMSHANPK